MDILTPRQKKILVMARESGKVSVDRLSIKLAVSPQTIRKDINELCAHQLLRRTHGGAIIGSRVENVSYEARKILAPDAKIAIGKQAAKLIPNNCALLLNIGTTTEQVAHFLKSHRGLMVITNNINAVEILRRSKGIELVISGGIVRQSDGGIIGEAAVDFINQFKADYAVIGVSAIDEDGTLLEYDYREVRIAAAIIANARHVILVADQMKFSRTASIRTGHISQVNTLVTDAAPPPRLVKLCRELEISIVIAPNKGKTNP